MKKLLIIIITSLILVLAGCKTQPVDSEIELVMNAGGDTVEINTTWINPGADLLVNDSEYEALSSGTVNTSLIGMYSIDYSYTYDEIDYLATRYVMVVDQTNPVIILLSGIDTVLVGETWSDAGATVADNSLEVLVATITGSVDTSVAGEYEITYTATDSSGNSIALIRYVNVIE